RRIGLRMAHAPLTNPVQQARVLHCIKSVESVADYGDEPLVFQAADKLVEWLHQPVLLLGGKLIEFVHGAQPVAKGIGGVPDPAFLSCQSVSDLGLDALQQHAKLLHMVASERFRIVEHCQELNSVSAIQVAEIRFIGSY